MPGRPYRVLAVDDEPEVTRLLGALLRGAGYDTRTAATAAEARRAFEEWRPDVVLLDLLLPDADGLDVLRAFKDRQPDSEVIVLTGDATIPRAVDATKAGAFTFVPKGGEPDALLTHVASALEHKRLVDENRALQQQLRDRFRYANIIGKSRKMHDLLDLVESVAASDANVLIVGENGTGKELIANALHANSGRSRRPFIKINCAAIPKDLIEAELFGYRKGAFTGALVDREGLVEQAEGGSLLLDEIAEMPTYLQTKLLRVLQEREYRPIGSDRIVRVDFRLICATNADIHAAIQDGRFREDLYFRINTITLKVPPLRERAEDIPLLCAHFLEKYRERHSREVRGIASAAYQLFLRHRWPGNVRELENAVERGVLVAKTSEITPQDLPESMRGEQPAWTATGEFVTPPDWTLEEIEKAVIQQTLERTHWNKQEAAQRLGLYRPTLYSKMKKHDIADPTRQRRSGA